MACLDLCFQLCLWMRLMLMRLGLCFLTTGSRGLAIMILGFLCIGPVFIASIIAIQGSWLIGCSLYLVLLLLACSSAYFSACICFIVTALLLILKGISMYLMMVFLYLGGSTSIFLFDNDIYFEILSITLLLFEISLVITNFYYRLFFDLIIEVLTHAHSIFGLNFALSCIIEDSFDVTYCENCHFCP